MLKTDKGKETPPQFHFHSPIQLALTASTQISFIQYQMFSSSQQHHSATSTNRVRLAYPRPLCHSNVYLLSLTFIYNLQKAFRLTSIVSRVQCPSVQNCEVTCCSSRDAWDELIKGLETLSMRGVGICRFHAHECPNKSLVTVSVVCLTPVLSM